MRLADLSRLAAGLDGVSESRRDGLLDWRYRGRLVARQLADAYGVTDTDGSRPDCWGYIAAYGWEQEEGQGIDEFR